MKKFKPVVFVLSFFTVGALTLMSTLAAFGEDEGQKLNGFWLFFFKLYQVLRFPTHTLFFNFFVNGWFLFLFGLFINSVIYAFLTERLFSLFRKKPKFPSIPTGI